MTDLEFRYFLDLLMCADPWPVEGDNAASEATLKNFADEQARQRGYAGWIDAYHRLLSAQSLEVRS